jgi:hypothetical protein
MALLEVEESVVVREGLEVATGKVLELFEGIREGAALTALLDRWSPNQPSPEALRRVLELPEKEREALADAVKADLSFPRGFSEPGYRFLFADLSSTTKKPAEELLSSIYRNVFCRGHGFEFEPGRFVTRSTWEDEFRLANPGLEVCPACAAYNLPVRARGRSLADLDHYLPKWKYPPLVLHSLNLLLMCKECNEVLKGSTDPLTPSDGPCRLGDVWFPYVRAGVSEIEVTFDPRAKEYKVQFTGEGGAVARARRHDQIFSLRERWSKMLDQIQNNLPGDLVVLEAEGNLASVKSTLEKLRRMAERRERSASGALVESRYFAWLQEEPAALRALVQQVRRLT